MLFPVSNLSTQLTLLMSWFLRGEEISPRFLGGAVMILLGLIINQPRTVSCSFLSGVAAGRFFEAFTQEKIVARRQETG
jgi:hypothetical protein